MQATSEGSPKLRAAERRCGFNHRAYRRNSILLKPLSHALERAFSHHVQSCQGRVQASGLALRCALHWPATARGYPWFLSPANVLEDALDGMGEIREEKTQLK